MSKPEFVYTTYIETTAEKLWHALTDGDFTERYWFGHRVASEWKVGGPYQFTKQGKPSVEGEVLEPAEAARLHLGCLLSGRQPRAHLSRHLRSRSAWQRYQADRDSRQSRRGRQDLARYL
jgi:uncharacterized protein YndB with AHSA1/START domain